MRNVASDRLRQCLDYWKSLCWHHEAQVRCALKEVPISAMPGLREAVPRPVLNWRKFEHTIFDNTVQELHLEDWGVTSEQQRSFQMFNIFSVFPFEFFEWSRKSRRVFELPADLFALFANAEYPEIHWEDVMFPFDSFAITLQEAIEIEDEFGLTSLYDCILVTKIPFENSIRMRLIQRPHVPPEEQTLHQRVIDRFEIFHKRGDYDKALRHIQQAWSSFNTTLKATPGWRCGTLWDLSRTPATRRVALEVEDFAAQIEPHVVAELEGGIEENLWRIEPLSIAGKIVVGLCLYLQAVTARSPHWKKQKAQRHIPGRRGVTGVITETDHICMILGSARMDADRYGVREEFNKHFTGFFKRPHWRRRHLKRERGAPIGAPKTVKVPPQLIRKDLIPFFGLIGGTKTEIIDDGEL